MLEQKRIQLILAADGVQVAYSQKDGSRFLFGYLIQVNGHQRYVDSRQDKTTVLDFTVEGKLGLMDDIHEKHISALILFNKKPPKRRGNVGR